MVSRFGYAFSAGGIALMLAVSPSASAQGSGSPTPFPSPQVASTPSPPDRMPGRIIGIETNREMIAAEAATEIVINGEGGANCALTIEYGDGVKDSRVVSDASPFPIKLSHTYAKVSDPMLRVRGTVSGPTPACDGTAEVSVHISPAGSKIEYVTLSSGCPEGWQLKGAVNADKSFICAPIPDASAATNLIHCIDGMKYFVKDGHVGCRHPTASASAPGDLAKASKGKPVRTSDKTSAKPHAKTMPVKQSAPATAANAASKTAN